MESENEVTRMGILKKRVNEFPTPYTCTNAIHKSGLETKLSMVLMGLGNIVHGQIIKGLLYLAVEVAYIVFMVMTGAHCLAMLPSLGSVVQEEVWDEAQQIYTYTEGDQSILILLFGVATVLITFLMVCAWRGALRSAYKAECLAKEGKHVNNFVEDLKTLLHENLQRLLMTPPMFFIGAFTILPLIFMICMAFTNYSKIDSHLMLFDWVGLDNFKALFDSSSILGSTFWSVLGWTLVWAFFATFSNYIFGMIVSLLINRKGTRAKGGVFCNIFKLHIRYDRISFDQPQGNKGKRILEILFCSLMCSTDVRFSSDHENDAPAGRRDQRAAEKSGADRSGCKPSVLHRSDVGEGDCHRNQCMGRCAVHTSAAHRRTAEYPGRALRSGKSGRGECTADLHEDHVSVYAVCDDAVPDRYIYRKCQ